MTDDFGKKASLIERSARSPIQAVEAAGPWRAASMWKLSVVSAYLRHQAARFRCSRDKPAAGRGGFVLSAKLAP
jgi:hypothetical protein